VSNTLSNPVIVGAGPVARGVASALAERGHIATAVSRSGTPVPHAVTAVGDVTDAQQARDLLAGASVVFQCAQPAYHRWPQEFPPLQTAVLDACAHVGAPLIATENLYGYGMVDGPIDPGLPLIATTRKGAVRAAMWEELHHAHESGRVRTAAVRASDFFGPGVDGSAFGNRFFDAIRRDRPAEVLGDPEALHSITYVADLGRALVAVAADERSWGRAWHAPTAPAVSQRRLVEITAEAAGTRPRIRNVPTWQLRLLGLFSKPIGEMIELRYEFEHDYVIDSSEFESHFHLSPTPLETSLAETVAGEYDDAAVVS
jgi:nucleoside-diphosphate-sugar epimerase